MKLVVISASQRHSSQSRKVANYIIKQSAGFDFKQTSLIDLGEHPLPLWDEKIWKHAGQWPEWLGEITVKIKEADAYVLVIPEWNGAATPAIKNFLLFFGERETGHKPVLLISISNEANGQYPVSDMRAFGGKNNKWIYIPDHLIIRYVNELLNKSEATGENDRNIRARIAYSLQQLKLYAKQLRPLRENYPFDERFKYAM